MALFKKPAVKTLFSIASLAFVGLFVSVVSSPGVAHAHSWCARPLWAHEWGVQSFDSQGVPTEGTLPSWFHQSASPAATPSPVRHLPADNGDRELPVLHFYSPRGPSPIIPIGIEVGFRRGAATHWFPQVQGLRTAAQANSPTSLREREGLLRARAAREPFGVVLSPLDRDPTRQLFWDFLELRARPAQSPHATTVPWIRAARALDALWVNGAQESERFVFYEGVTRERPLVRLVRGNRYSPGHRHIIVHNRSAYPVHDVFLTHREEGRVYVVYVPRVPAGRRAGFILEEHAIARAEFSESTRGRLRARLSTTNREEESGCSMLRDPAIPTESATSHRLYDGEVDLVLQTWGADFFDGAGTTLLYREDITYLDAMMPMSIYTDMYNFVVLHRAGLAVQRGVSLP